MTRGTWIRRLFFIGLAGALLATPGIHAQGGQQSPPAFPWAGQDAAIPYPDTFTPPAVNFDPQDLTGVWLRRGFQGLSDDPPQNMSAAGMALFKESIVAVPNELTDDPPPPIQGNDPIMQCDPYGFPRVLWDFNAPMEMGHLPNKIVQFFEWTAVWRTIWMDGRELPEDPDPRWMGYSVGRWDGDTLVVETVGMDERTWIDERGHRHSGNSRFVERYRRVDARTMEYDATLFDPDFYTEPWVGTTRNFLLLPMEGWPQVGLREEFCAPSVEGDFNLTIRDPAGGKEQ